MRLLREELQLLHEAGSYVGEVVKPMGKTKVLVKVIHMHRFLTTECKFFILKCCFVLRSILKANTWWMLTRK